MLESLAMENQLEKIHQLQFDMLKVFDEFCKKHNLQYWLACGSVLGAIRHNGFVPWDDDIDIMMLRDDYERMLILIPDELPSHLFLQSYKSDLEYPLHFSKIRMNNTVYQEEELEHLSIHHGIYIDLFPIDYTSTSKFGQFYHRAKIYFYQKLKNFRYQEMIPKSQNYWFIKQIIQYIVKSVDKKTIDKHLHRAYTMYFKKKNNPLSVFFGIKGKTYIMPQDTLIPARLTAFRSLMVPVPNKYELYLEKLYGNYNELPPPEKRKPFLYHKVKYFKLDKNGETFYTADYKNVV